MQQADEEHALSRRSPARGCSRTRAPRWAPRCSTRSSPASSRACPAARPRSIARQLERQMVAWRSRRPRLPQAGCGAAPPPCAGCRRRTPARDPDPGGRACAAGFVQQHDRGFARGHQDALTEAIPKAILCRVFAGRAGRRTRPAGGSKRDRRVADGTPSVAQPVRHQGRPGNGIRARWPRSRPPRYVNGEAQKVVAKFRAYGEAVPTSRCSADYARMMKESPGATQAVARPGGWRDRDRGKVGASGTSSAVSVSSATGALRARLQRAGYATDPGLRCWTSSARPINTTLRMQKRDEGSG